MNVNKLSGTDLVIDLDKKTNELNKLRELAHKSIYEIKEITKNDLANIQDLEMKSFIESKSIEDKFKFYLEKLFVYINYKENILENLKAKLEVKESQINKLEKEIYYRNNKNLFTNKKEKSDKNKDINDDKTDKMEYKEPEMRTERKNLMDSKIFNTVIGSEVAKSVGKKRRFEDEIDKENSKNKMDIDNGIPLTYSNIKQSTAMYKSMKTVSGFPSRSEAKNFPSLI